MFYKKGVLKHLAEFTRKHLCWSHFSCEICEIFKSTFFVERVPVTASFKYDKANQSLGDSIIEISEKVLLTLSVNS